MCQHFYDVCKRNICGKALNSNRGEVEWCSEAKSRNKYCKRVTHVPVKSTHRCEACKERESKPMGRCVYRKGLTLGLQDILLGKLQKSEERTESASKPRDPAGRERRKDAPMSNEDVRKRGKNESQSGGRAHSNSGVRDHSQKSKKAEPQRGRSAYSQMTKEKDPSDVPDCKYAL